jgi:hypothetical protein
VGIALIGLGVSMWRDARRESESDGAAAALSADVATAR